MNFQRPSLNVYSSCLAAGRFYHNSLFFIGSKIFKTISSHFLNSYKAVVWTDTLQIICMIAGFFTIIIEGAMTFGGWSKIHEAAVQRGLFVNDFRPDPTIR